MLNIIALLFGLCLVFQQVKNHAQIQFFSSITLHIYKYVTLFF